MLVPDYMADYRIDGLAGSSGKPWAHSHFWGNGEAPYGPQECDLRGSNVPIRERNHFHRRCYV